MRFHLLTLPNTETTKEYCLDGFNIANMRMARLLKELGHEVFIYGGERNEAPCDEHVCVVTNEERETLMLGIPYQYAGFFSEMYPLWSLANKRMIREIEKRKQPKDFILTIGGVSQEEVALGHPDLMTVEYSIGYISCFSKYRVYESHYWRAAKDAWEGRQDGRWFDAVIPMFFPPEEFPFRSEKEPFALFVGRLTTKKGLEIACKAAELAGMPLKVIGHGDEGLVTNGAEYLGALSSEERNDWMSRAQVCIFPTIYSEPFGAVAVEAQLCGTPVVASGFGGFVETVEENKTGFLCNYMGEFVRGLKRAKELNPLYIADRARAKYSIDAVKHQYEAYFRRLNLLWDEGFDSLK